MMKLRATRVSFSMNSGVLQDFMFFARGSMYSPSCSLNGRTRFLHACPASGSVPASHCGARAAPCG